MKIKWIELRNDNDGELLGYLGLCSKCDMQEFKNDIHNIVKQFNDNGCKWSIDNVLKTLNHKYDLVYYDKNTERERIFI